MFFIDVSIWAKMRHINVCVCFNCRGSSGTKWNVNAELVNIRIKRNGCSSGTKWNVNIAGKYTINISGIVLQELSGM